MKGKGQALGKRFEEEIEATNTKYRMQKVGLISKVPTGVKPIPIGKGKVRWIPVEKTGCDFLGHYQGLGIAIESKSTNNKTAFQLTTHDKPMIQPHQIRFLQDFERSGGLAFILIKFTPIRRYFRVPASKYMALHKNTVQAKRKSIPIAWFEEYEVKIQDYLKGANDK